MPPATSTRIVRDPRPHSHNNDQTASPSTPDLFTDPMMGAALTFYIDKDVEDKDRVSQVITVRPFFLTPRLVADYHL